MSLQFIFMAIMASIAVAMPSSRIAVVNPTDTTAVDWPSFLLGYGSLQVNVTAMTEDVNSTMLDNMLHGKLLSDLYIMSKNATSACPIQDPVDPSSLSPNSAVVGDLCLSLDDYEGMIANGTGNHSLSDSMPGPSNNNTDEAVPADDCNSCQACCELSCIGALLLWPLCVAICEDAAC